MSENPGGKTKEQRAAEVQSAEDSAKIRALMTAKLLKEMTAQDADPTKFIDPAVLKLLKDSEDRGHGTPVQAIHMSMEDNVRGKSDAEIDAGLLSLCATAILIKHENA